MEYKYFEGILQVLKFEFQKLRIFEILHFHIYIYMQVAKQRSSIANWLMHEIVNIFLPIGLNICFGCSKEPSH